MVRFLKFFSQTCFPNMYHYPMKWQPISQNNKLQEIICKLGQPQWVLMMHFFLNYMWFWHITWWANVSEKFWEA
jgi:hypothetical protein